MAEKKPVVEVLDEATQVPENGASQPAISVSDEAIQVSEKEPEQPGQPENDTKTDSIDSIDPIPTSDPPPYSKAPLKEVLTIEKSECWTQGRKLFTDRVTKGKTPDKTLAAELSRFFDKTRTLQKTIDRCEEIQASAEKRSDSVGNLAFALNTFKSVGDVVLTSAPETIGAVWFAIGFVIKVVADDAETCQIVAEVYNQVSKIAIASLLYEERCSRSGSQDNLSNVVSLEKIIVENVAGLVCEILDFFWNTKRWAVKLKSAAEAEETDGSTALRDESTTEGKSKGFRHAVKAAGKKAGGAIKDAVKSTKDKIMEAFTGDLKAKAQSILDLYQILQNDGTVQFEQMVVDSMQNMNEDVRNSLNDFKTGLDSCLNSITETMIRIERKQSLALEAVQELDNKAEDLLEGHKELKEGIKKLQETKKTHLFETYINCFRRSVAQENLLQTLYTKKAQDGASNDRCWLLKQDRYTTWKSLSGDTSRILCLEAERGHGKTMTMLSVASDLEIHGVEPWDLDSRFVLRFFFKLGDNELQSALRGLESLLRQLLKKFSDQGESKSGLNDKAKKICEILERNGIDQIRKETEKEDVTIKDSMASTEETKNPALITRIISQIAAELKLKLWIVLDALDECHDLKTSNLVRCIRDLAYSEALNIWVIVSTRSSSHGNDIEAEFRENDIAINSNTVQAKIPSAKIVTLTNRENKEELQLFLELKLRDLVRRRVGKLDSNAGSSGAKTDIESRLKAIAAKEVVDEAQVDEKVKVLAEKINKIVNGDFSYAGMLIANLQEPSKKSLEARIKELEGRGLEDMYRRNLDVLTPGKRTLILFSLKWVVWSVSDVTAIEIAEHFREVYHDIPVSDDTLGSPSEEIFTTNAGYDPSEDPEIREIISHLRTAGRDFFSFSGDNDRVTAHTSVREWILNGASPPVDLRNSEARIVKSVGGRLVFEIAVPSESIPKDYNELSELMSEEESHLSIASDILRALTNKSFQNRYMPWRPPKEFRQIWTDKFPQPQEALDSTSDTEDPEESYSSQEPKDSKRRRYEIRHWVDHIQALETYRHRTPEQAKNPKWNILQTLLEKFIQPENWYRWHIQRRVMGGHTEKWAYSFDCYQEPIQVAALLGLKFLIDHLHSSNGKKEGSENSDGRDGPDPSDANEIDGILDRYDGVGRTPLSLALRDPKTVEYLLKAGAQVDRRLKDYGYTALSYALEAADTEKEDRKKLLESVRLLLKYGAKDQIPHALGITIPLIIDEDFIKEGIAEYQKTYSEITIMLLEKYDKEREPLNVGALFLSAMEAISQCPTQATDIWNRAKLLFDLEENVAKSQDENSLTPLHILVRAVYDHPAYADTLIHIIKYLFNYGADPLISYTGHKSDPYYGNPVLLAVQTRNPKLFDMFLERGEELFRSRSLSGACAMHYFFKGKHGPLSEEDKRLFEHLVKLSPPGEATNESSDDSETEIAEKEIKKVPYFINAEDNDSREPLSWAIEAGDKDGVALLLQHGADVDDVDELGQTGLYYLASIRGDSDDTITILKDLHGAGADIRISTASETTVFAQAVHRQPPSVLREFVQVLPRVERKPDLEQNKPEKNDSEKKDPEQKDPEQKDPEQTAIEQNDSNQSHPEQKDSDQKGFKQKDSEPKNTEEKDPEQNDLEQNGSEQINSDQNDSKGNDSKEVVEVFDTDYLLQNDDQGRNFLHHAAEREDWKEADISDILDELLKQLPEKDQQELVSQKENEFRATPLLLALKRLNIPLIKVLLGYSKSEIKEYAEDSEDSRNSEGSKGRPLSELINAKLTEFEAIVYEAKESDNSMDDYSGSEQINYEEMMRKLLVLSDIRKDDSVIIRLREFAVQMSWARLLGSIITRGVDCGVQDQYGWNGYHLENYYGTARNLSRVHSLYGREVDVTPIPRPSVLRTEFPEYVEISENGLEVTMNRASTVSLNSPIDFALGQFYFEVEVRNKASDRTKYSWAIGIIPTYMDSHSKMYTVGLGWYGYDGAIHGSPSLLAANKRSSTKYLERWGQDNTGEPTTVGLGIDHEEGSIIFTKDGKLVGTIPIQIRGRYIPAISVPADGTARIKLGDEDDFKYERLEGGRPPVIVGEREYYDDQGSFLEERRYLRERQQTGEHNYRPTKYPPPPPPRVSPRDGYARYPPPPTRYDIQDEYDDDSYEKDRQERRRSKLRSSNKYVEPTSSASGQRTRGNRPLTSYAYEDESMGMYPSSRPSYNPRRPRNESGYYYRHPKGDFE